LLFYLLSSFVNEPPRSASYPLPLHDALPISARAEPPGAREVQEPLGPRAAVLDGLRGRHHVPRAPPHGDRVRVVEGEVRGLHARSEEHTSELQSRENLVCRLLLEKKKTPTSF